MGEFPVVGDEEIAAIESFGCRQGCLIDLPGQIERSFGGGVNSSLDEVTYGRCFTPGIDTTFHQFGCMQTRLADATF